MTKHYESYEDHKRLKVISINVYPYQLEALDKIIKSGYGSNRSLLIRRVLDRYLGDFVKTLKVFEVLTPEQVKLMGDGD